MRYYEKEMDTIHPEGCEVMTWEDAEAMEKLNEEHCWGFSTPDLLRLIADHLEALMVLETSGDRDERMNAERTMEKIEYRLEDANFHKLVRLLSETDYDNAVKEVMAM